MEEITNTIQIDELLGIFNDTVKKGIDESTPKLRIKSTFKDLPNNIKIMFQFRNIYRRNWKRYRDINDHRQMTRLNKEICIETYKLRNLNWNNMQTTMESLRHRFGRFLKF